MERKRMAEVLIKHGTANEKQQQNAATVQYISHFVNHFDCLHLKKKNKYEKNTRIKMNFHRLCVTIEMEYNFGSLN